LAVEWGPHYVRVNALAPAIVRTDFAKRLWEDPDLYARAVAAYPLRRIGEPDEVAGAAVFLASRAGGFINRANAGNRRRSNRRGRFLAGHRLYRRLRPQPKREGFGEAESTSHPAPEAVYWLLKPERDPGSVCLGSFFGQIRPMAVVPAGRV
jgi:hypothetical protein